MSLTDQHKARSGPVELRRVRELHEPVQSGPVPPLAEEPRRAHGGVHRRHADLRPGLGAAAGAGVTGEGFFRSVFLFPMAVSLIASGRGLALADEPGPGRRRRRPERLFSSCTCISWRTPGGPRAEMATWRPWRCRRSGSCPATSWRCSWPGSGASRTSCGRRPVDGASKYKLYRHVLFPQLTPVALSALIILGHMSMKMFDLIYAVSGPPVPHRGALGLRVADLAARRPGQGGRDRDLAARGGRRTRHPVPRVHRRQESER